ncbi:MAG: PAS domain S-box protein, partial [Thermoplasmata archaeon]
KVSGDYGATFISENVTQMVGYKSKNFIKKTNFWIDHVHPDDKKLVLNEVSKISKKDWHTFMYRFKRKDGTYIWVRDDMKLIRGEDGKPLEIVGYWVDITLQKKSDEVHRESEEKYSNLFHNSNDAIIIHDLKGKILDVNQRALDLFGLSRKEALKLKVPDLHPPEELKKSKKAFKNIAKDGFISFEINFKKKNKEVFPAEVSSSIFEMGGKNVIQGIVRDITERKKAEDALKESEEMYRSLVETSPDAVTVTDLEGKITYVSDRAVEFTGFKKAKEIIGKNAFDFIDPKDQEIALRNLQKTLNKGYLRNIEYTMLKRDGSRYTGELNAAIIKDAQGNPKAFIGTTRDVTKRKQAEEALRESEEKFRSLAEKSPNMIYINRMGAVVYANEECENVTGYTREEFYSPDFDFLTLVAPESREMVKGNFAKHMKGIEVPPYEYTLITKQGKRIEVINATKMISYGREPAILGIVTDITERKNAEKEIKKLNEFNESIVQSMAEGIMILDEEGIITFTNPKIESMLGHKKQKLIGEHWENIIVPDYHKRMRDCYAENLRGEGDRFEGVFVKKNRTELPVSFSASPQIKDGVFKGILAVITDISERKKEEIAREELMRYKVKRGSSYLIEEKELDRGKDLIYELFKNRLSGVIITREHPEKIKKEIDIKLPLYWMTNDPRDRMSVKPEFPLLEKIIDDNIDRNTFVFLDRFDYLVTQNDFKEALNFIQHLNEIFYARKAILIISLDPDTLTSQELSLLEKETSTLEKRHEERLSADLIDLLEFVNRHNRVGDSPSYKQVGDEFKISRTTARKRIKELVDKGLMVEKKSGRFKYLVLTEKGKDSI